MALTDRAEEILAKQLGNGRAVELRAALDLAYGSGGNDTLNDRGRYLVSKIFGRTRGEEFCAIADAAGRIEGDRASNLLERAFGQSDGNELFAEFDEAYPDVMPPTIDIPLNGDTIDAPYATGFTLTGDNWFIIDIPENDPPVDTTIYLVCGGPGGFTAQLASTTGLTFTVGNDSTAEMSFYGARDDVLAALAAVTFTTEGGTPASTPISINITNAGGTDYAEIDFTLTGPLSTPNLIIGGDETIPMDDPYPITGIDLTDSESADQEVTVTVTNGVATLNNLTGLIFSVGDGTNDVTMTFSGALADVVSGIETITFTPTESFTGAASLSISTVNTYGGTDSVLLGITVEAP